MPELHRDGDSGRKDCRQSRLLFHGGHSGLAPLVQAGWANLERGIVCDSKSGVSGAGKAPTAKTHFMYAADNLSAYSVFGHRHTGEILEQLGSGSAADYFYATFAADSARNFFDDVREVARADAGLGDCRVLSQLLQRLSDGALARGTPAGDSTCGAHELLRSRICIGGRRTTVDCRLLPGQSIERCCGPGGAEYEFAVWLAGAGGTA